MLAQLTRRLDMSKSLGASVLAYLYGGAFAHIIHHIVTPPFAVRRQCEGRFYSSSAVVSLLTLTSQLESTLSNLPRHLLNTLTISFIHLHPRPSHHYRSSSVCQCLPTRRYNMSASSRDPHGTSSWKPTSSIIPQPAPPFLRRPTSTSANFTPPNDASAAAAHMPYPFNAQLAITTGLTVISETWTALHNFLNCNAKLLCWSTVAVSGVVGVVVGVRLAELGSEWYRGRVAKREAVDREKEMRRVGSVLYHLRLAVEYAQMPGQPARAARADLIIDSSMCCNAVKDLTRQSQWKEALDAATQEESRWEADVRREIETEVLEIQEDLLKSDEPSLLHRSRLPEGVKELIRLGDIEDAVALGTRVRIQE